MIPLTSKLRSNSDKAQETEHLSVALLMDDLAQAKELSRLFKRMDIHPYVYQNLKEFWRGTLEQIPSLCIVDVKLTSAGELFLKNHPYIKNEQMPLVFYTSKATRPLMASVMNIFHLGEITQEGPLAAQVKANLKRLNRVMSLEETAYDEGLKNQKYDQQIERLIAENQNLKEKEYYQRLLNSYCQRFEMKGDEESFINACSRVFTDLREIKEFSFLELSESTQKLISPDLASSKFKRIPSLWLGRSCPDGIEPFAQNMASQVGVDLMGGELMCLGIRGVKNDPMVMIFLKLNQSDMLNLFDWEAFERFLSGLYCAFELRYQDSALGARKWLNSWELMNLLDEELYGRTRPSEKALGQEQLINVSFKQLVDVIQQRPQRFYWKHFHEDFLARLATQTDVDFKVCPFGVDLMSFLVKKEDSDKLFSALKSFSARFSYWKYFENSEAVIGKVLKPDVRMVPFASRGYLKAIEEASENRSTPLELEKAYEDAPQKLNVWGRRPEQNM